MGRLTVTLWHSAKDEMALAQFFPAPSCRAHLTHRHARCRSPFTVTPGLSTMTKPQDRQAKAGVTTYLASKVQVQSALIFASDATQSGSFPGKHKPPLC